MPLAPDVVMTPEEINAFLDEPRIAVLATNGRDGTPAQNPVWYIWEAGRLLMSVSRSSYYARNLVRAPRISVCIQQETSPFKAVVMKGAATVVHDEDYAFGRRIAVRYMGERKGLKYADGVAKADGENMLVVTLVPEKLASWDYAKWG